MKKQTLVDYAIISAKNLDELQTKVQEFQIERAGAGVPVEWYPSGSPVFHKEKSGTWHQAMYGVDREFESA
jgi:hypothetical protein